MSENVEFHEYWINLIGPLHDPVSWYGINYAGTKITQWEFQNKEMPDWTGKSSCVLEVPLRYLRPSIIYSVPCDRIVQSAYFRKAHEVDRDRLDDFRKIFRKCVVDLPCDISDVCENCRNVC